MVNIHIFPLFLNFILKEPEIEISALPSTQKKVIPRKLLLFQPALSYVTRMQRLCILCSIFFLSRYTNHFCSEINRDFYEVLKMDEIFAFRWRIQL
jgi:hypothetical protein